MASLFYTTSSDWVPKPMVCTLFPSHFRSDSASKFFFTHQDADELEDAFQLINATSGCRQAELIELLERSSRDRLEDQVHLPYRVWNTSLLYEASQVGNWALVDTLLTRFHHDPHKGNRFGTSPLEIASMRNHGSVVFLLIKKGDVLTAASLMAAAQWNGFNALAAMYCAGALSILQDLDLLSEITTHHRHLDAMEMIRKIKDMSKVEIAADTINLPALRSLCDDEDVPLLPMDHLRRAFMCLNKSPLKMVRTPREFRDCKEVILLAQKRVLDMVKLLMSFRLKGQKESKPQLLSLTSPRAFRTLFEVLGIVAKDPKNRSAIQLDSLRSQSIFWKDPCKIQPVAIDYPED